MPTNFPIGTAINAGSNIANTLITQAFAEYNRKQNFKWNEKAAENADKRQRAQYFDLYSPQAMMEQYAAAGLSPSMMMSGGQSAVGHSSAQGNQSQGIQGAYPTAQVFDPIAAAQIGLIKAQTENIKQNTTATEIENGIKKLNASTFKNKWQLLNSTYFGNENGVQSWSYLTNNSENYQEFQNKVYNILKDTDSPELMFSQTEEGQNTLRQIYETNKQFGNDITVLANSEENAKLMLQITNLLNQQGFANESANAQMKQLKQVSESAELTTEQKSALNRLIDKMGHSTSADILLALLMMIGQYSHANLNFGVTQTNQIKK